MVSVGGVCAKHLGLPHEQLLALIVERVPFRQVVRPGSELCVSRNHAQSLLVGENLVPHRIPAFIEQVHVMDLVDPLGRRLVRRVRGARDVIDKERLLGRRRIQLFHVVDGVIGHVGDKVIAGLPDPGKDLSGVAEEERLPLAAVAAHEAVKILKSHPDWPLIERTGRAVLIRGCVVILAEPARGVAIVPQDRADGRFVLGNDAVVAGVAGGLLGDHAEADRVMVAPGNQRRARR